MNFTKSLYNEQNIIDIKSPINKIIFSKEKEKELSMESTVEEMSNFISKNVLDKIFDNIYFERDSF